MKTRPILFVLIPFCIIIILVDLFCPVFFIRNHYSNHKQEGQYYKILIKEEANERNNSIRYKAKITHYLHNNQWKATTGDIMLYFSKQDTAKNLKYGDVISTNAKLFPIKNFSDTSSFNYQKVMQRKRIYDNMFVRVGSWKMIEQNRGNFLIAKAKQFNKKLQLKLLNSNLPPQESALAIGMLLGDDKYIDTETQKHFTTSGLNHILCVSGMNIGMILIVIEILLKLLTFGNYKLILYRKIILVIIAFSLCFIVSLTPSSLRVAVMMTLLILTKYSKRGYDSINILSVTVFIFLCFDPLILFNLGFQFSFLAVFGLIIFANFREELMPRYKHNYITNKVLTTSGMTLSAQAFVMPLLLIRFKTFPTYFLIANIIIVPFMSVLLTTIIFFLIIGDIPYIGTLAETILHYQLYATKSVVEFIDSLPYSSIYL